MTSVAICSALPVSPGAPQWIHLLPSGTVRTIDGRGPYEVPSLQALASQLQPGDKLPVDECHSTDLAAPHGREAPARGWIVELQARANGLWGRVEWTGVGRRLLLDGAYRGISPVIKHNKAKVVLSVLRASLTNTPNLLGLVSLHGIDAARKEELDATEIAICSAMGLSHRDYLAAKQAKQVRQEFDATDIAICSALGISHRDYLEAKQSKQVRRELDATDIAICSALGVSQREYLEAKQAKQARADAALSDDERHIISRMGISQADYLKSRDKRRIIAL